MTEVARNNIPKHHTNLNECVNIWMIVDILTFLKKFEDEKARVYLCGAGSSDGYRAACTPEPRPLFFQSKLRE